MDSLTYKTLRHDFTNDVRQLTEELEEAVGGRLSGEELAGVTRRVQEKLAQYETSLQQFGDDDGKRESFVESLSEWVTELTDGLAALKKAGR